MKNVFFCLTFMLVSFCSFAKTEKRSVIVSQKVDKAECSQNVLYEATILNIDYVGAGATCYAEVRYNGVLVITIPASGVGDNSFEAQLNCLQEANRLAQEYIKMMDKYLSEE